MPFTKEEIETEGRLKVSNFLRENPEKAAELLKSTEDEFIKDFLREKGEPQVTKLGKFLGFEETTEGFADEFRRPLLLKRATEFALSKAEEEGKILPRRKSQGFFSEFGRSLGKSGLKRLSALLNFVERFSEPASVFRPGLFGELSEKAKEASEKPELQAGRGTPIRSFIATSTADGITFTGTTIAATLAAGPQAGLAGAFVIEGEAAFEEAIARGATEEQAGLEMLIVGGINATLEQLRVNQIISFGRGGANTSFKKIAEAVKLKSFAKLKGVGADLSKDLLLNAISESVQEALQETTSVLAPALTGSGVVSFNDAVNRIFTAAAAGAIAGPVVGGGGAITVGLIQSGMSQERANAVEDMMARDVAIEDVLESASRPLRVLVEAEQRVSKLGAQGTLQDIETLPAEPITATPEPAKPKIGIKAPPTTVKPVVKPTQAPVKQIEVSDTEAAALLGESLEKIKANKELKARLSKELIITEFQPSDFVPKTKKGPGLTKAEQQVVTPKVQGELRFAQTQGLPVGFKAGQKEANDIAKRRLDDFRTARKVEKGALQDARKLVTEYAKDPVVAKKLITSLAKVDSPAKMAAFADKIGEFVREAERKQAITSYKITFNKLKKDNRLGKVAFGKLRPAARDRILKFADTIDLKKLSVAKKEELETLMGKVKDLGVDLSEGVRQLDVDTRDALNQLDPLIDSLDRLSKTAVSDMGLEEIRVAEDTLKYIVRQNEIENKQIFGERLVESRETETKAIAEVSVSKKQKKIFKKEAKKGFVAKAKRPGVFATLKRGTVGQSRTIPTLIQVSTVKGATATKKVLDDEIWDSFREANRTQFESVDFLREQYTKHNITVKTLDSFDKEFKVVVGGKSRVVTADDLGGMEMHLRSLDNLQQLRKTEGVWIQGKLVTDFTIKELVNAVEKLTPSQLKMLDIANLQNRTITAKAINEEFLNLWGYEPATNPNYWAIVRRFKKRVGGFLGINFSKAIEQQSSFQARTGGTKPIVIVPFRQQMWHSIQVGARARTAIAFHNARTLLNSDKWQNTMINAGRENEMNDIIKIFERTQGLSSDKDVLELAGQTLLSNLAKSKLSLRVTTPLVQVASFPVSFSEINTKYAIPLKGHRAQIGRAQLKRLKKFTPTLRLRFEGGRITPEVGNISATEGLRMLVFGKVGFTNKPLVPLRGFDRATILGIDIMVQRKIKDTTNLKGDEFWKAVSLETERVTRLTQPMWDHFARSVLLTNPNFFLRATIPFRAPREAMLGVTVRGNDSLAKGDKKQWARSMGAVSSSLVMARLIKLGVGALSTAILGILFKGRIPEKRKDLSDFATDLTNDAVSLAPFIGDVVAPAIEFAIEGKTFREVGFNNLLGDFAKTAGTVAFDGTKAAIQFADGDTKKAGENFQKALVGTLQVELERRGLPFTGIRDVLKPVFKKEPAGTTETFGRTRKTRTRPTRTRKTRTFGRRRR